MLSETRYINETYSIIYNYGKTYIGKCVPAIFSNLKKKKGLQFWWTLVICLVSDYHEKRRNSL